MRLVTRLHVIAAAALLAATAAGAAADSVAPADSPRDALRALYGGDIHGAISIAERLLQNEPANAVVRIHLARVLRESGRFAEALLNYDALLADDETGQSRLAAAETAVLAAQPQRALGYLASASPGPERLYVSALALADLGRRPEALAALAESLEAQPFRPLAWLQQAMIQQEQGDLDGAEASFLKALAQEPNLTAAFAPLARIYLSRGQTDKAHGLLRRAAASLPADRSIRELLARLDEQDPSRVDGLEKAASERRERATPRKAAAPPAERSAFPVVRIGLAEKVQAAHLKIGGKAVLDGLTVPAGSVLAARGVDNAVEVADADGLVILRSAVPVRLAFSDPADTTILFDVEYGRGSFWAGSEDRMYRGTIELAARPEGLTIVNELPIEEYLYSVLPSEMPSSWPAAALRAQAVAARSYTMANLGRFAARGFDLLGNVFSAAYRGMLAETPSVRTAVDATRGLVLMDGEQPLAAYYSANSGGHSETTQNVWGFASSLPALADPRLDAGAFPLPPEDLARWLAGRPQTFSSHPQYSGRSAYRWQLWVAPAEIEARIGRGEALGSVAGIEALGRGRSGRIPAVRVRGTSGEHVLRGDAIRWGLGGLRSNLFTVEPKMGADGLVQYFVFTGAGWGHGVGMCQSGAAGMAAEGYTAEQILSFYYGGVEMRRLY